ncbi:Y-family DNA polymerase [Aquibium oceanicum]|uniref:DNA repair protein n=1 Tax=Aquibium oceanicum TaxID=1670800 RepID=A0A1L3SY41_9HYPH|nr:DNA polymerase Y family protein [Aquibium oceanicum]APH74339.1 DNA repair protein [Aquibium oceanicum]
MVSRREKNAQRIAALDEQAEALRLKRGMGIADARAMHPAIEIVEADPAADRRLLEGLADWCDRYTPLVAIDGEDGLYLDISGCTHLFGGEGKMLKDLLARLSEQGFRARAGIASTAGTAWAAARFSGATIIAPGEEAAFLAGLPLAALRLDGTVCAALESVGLRSVGAILDAPRAPLARRFGRMPVTRLDQALGRVEEAVSPRLPVATLSVERNLAEPVQRMEDIEELVFLLAVTAKGSLETRGEGARLLELALFRVDGDVSRVAVGTSRPMREPHLIRKLFHEKLSATEIDAGYGFDLVRLSVRESARFDTRQGDLVAARVADEERLALFADRVGARLGRQTIRRPVLAESHLPERAMTTVAFADAPAVEHAALSLDLGERQVPEAVERPIRLFGRPEPIEASAEVPEGPPFSFRWRRTLYRVARAEGPERIAPEWWRASAEERTRDYYRVEDTRGRRFWLCREGLYDGSPVMPRWFVHGLFA